MKIFLSYHFHSEFQEYDSVVHRVNYFLNKQPDIESFCYADERDDRSHGLQNILWKQKIYKEQMDSIISIVFYNGEWGDTQLQEIQIHLNNNKHLIKNIGLINLTPNEMKIEGRYENLLSTEISLGNCTEQKNAFCNLIEYSSRSDSKQYNIIDQYAKKIAQIIVQEKVFMYKKDKKWVIPDGLPNGYPYDYEKDIIEAFAANHGKLLNWKKLQDGCPLFWPEIQKVEEKGDLSIEDNPVLSSSNPDLSGKMGSARKGGNHIIVDVRTRHHKPHSESDNKCLAEDKLYFLEAGPRDKVIDFSGKKLKVGILVSGGIAPGMNAVIDGILERHSLYKKGFNKKKDESDPKHEVKIILYKFGFSQLKDSGLKKEITFKEFSNRMQKEANRGGSVVPTARFDDLLDNPNITKRNELISDMVQCLYQDDIDILYVIGGEGTMRAAHVIAQRIKNRLEDKVLQSKFGDWLREVPLKRKHPRRDEISLWFQENSYGEKPELIGKKKLKEKEISIVGIPKTMDNDILWVWQSFGFLSAVEEGKRLIHQLHTEAKSNPRLCIAQLFGSDSGFVVSHVATASGVCHAALIPEASYSLHKLSLYIREHLEPTHGSYKDSEFEVPYGLILLAETAIPEDVEDFLDSKKYTELKLDESEINEIRKFIGSSYITLDDFFGNLEKKDDPIRTKLKRLREIVDAFKDLASFQKKENESEVYKTADLRRLISSYMGVFIEYVSKNEVINNPQNFESITSDLIKLININLIRNPKLIPINADMKPYSKLTGITQELIQIVDNLINSCSDHDMSYPPKGLEIVRGLNEIQLPYDTRAVKNILESIVSKTLEDHPEKDENELQQLSWDRLIAYMKKEDSFQAKQRTLAKLKQRLCEKRNRFILIEQLNHVLKGRNQLCFDIENRFQTGERRVHGQTPDALRTGCLKIVSHVLQADIRRELGKVDSFFQNYRVFVNEPRHLIRSVDPSTSDLIFGHRLGNLAVDSALAGYTDFMVSQWLTEFVLVPLDLVVLGRKRIPQNGIFWKSVVAETGQPDLIERLPTPKVSTDEVIPTAG